MIIDDEVEIVELMEVYLVNEGYKVFKAYNGNYGINIVNKEKHTNQSINEDTMQTQ